MKNTETSIYSQVLQALEQKDLLTLQDISKEHPWLICVETSTGLEFDLDRKALVKSLHQNVKIEA